MAGDRRSRLTDDEARRILARATQLDQERLEGAAFSDLRQAAIEAGISSASFDTAMSEHLETQRRPTIPGTPTDEDEGSGSSIVSMSTLGIMLAATSLLVTQLFPESPTGDVDLGAIFAAIALIAASVGAAWIGTLREYVLHFGVLCLAFLGALLMMAPGWSPSESLYAAAAAGVVGIAVNAWRRAKTAR